MKQTPQMSLAPGGTEVHGRTCSECTLCCTVLGIVELQKPVFTICKHCVIGKGCKIYDVKPQTCTGFLCYYRLAADVAEYWNPKVCGMVLHRETGGEMEMISIICSSSAKHRWKEEPYWSDIRQMVTVLNARYRGYVRIIRKGKPVLVLDPKTFEARPVGNLKEMAALPVWRQHSR